jgi:hypothetical protein
MTAFTSMGGNMKVLSALCAFHKRKKLNKRAHISPPGNPLPQRYSVKPNPCQTLKLGKKAP